jgi:hypothetical protein
LVERVGFRARYVVETEYDLRVCGRKLGEVYRELTGCVTRRAAA